MKHFLSLPLVALIVLCSAPLSHATEALNILGIGIGCPKHVAMEKMSYGRSNQNVRIVKQRLNNSFDEPEMFEFGLEAFSRAQGQNYAEASRFRAILAPSGEVIGLSQSLRFNDRVGLPMLTKVRRSLIKRFGIPAAMHWDQANRQMVFAWLQNEPPAGMDKRTLTSKLEKCTKRGCWSDASRFTEDGRCPSEFGDFLLVRVSPATHKHFVSRIDYTLASTDRINSTVAHFNGILNSEMTATK
ncbi:hypothetical protein [Desulfocurvus sp. DL9XJH121]